ncbi:NAD(P)-binding protein [Fomitopsis serialis]|uniref:NAD(P)-binding protein n=1 Tax=Fomitopsis serialis TaxID=139415 RepID=UPI0020077055|nr:NAD(P)-binding protein [Neoantrodia serialis]KAH9930009.1 NAD(P)-binding protein [Neoantrodia serialis]
MVAVQAGKVLVTGANGFIAMWVVKSLLDQGYIVRGTVRSESKAKHVREVFSRYGDKFEVVIIDDITKPGAFDEYVKDIDAIEHTASPFHFKANDPDELIIPAVHGTTRILESALAHGKNVKRIVITSSTAAVLSIQSTPRTFTEADWNEAAIQLVHEEGAKAPNAMKYRASKTLAEKAAWEFVEKNKGVLGWDLVVLNPPYVFGPAIHEVGAPEALNESMHDWFHTVFKGSKTKEQLASIGSCWIDVRDLAEAHVLAIKKQEAGGERIMVSEGPYKWQDFVDAAQKFYPNVSPRDEAYNPAKATHQIQYDTSKAAKVLGIKYHSIEEGTKDMVEDFKARDWI